MKQFLRFLLGAAAFTFLFLSINGSGNGWWLERTAYGGMADAKPLELLVLPKALTYQKIHLIESGFEFELLQQFALDAGYNLKIKVIKSEKELLKRMSRGEGDMAAGRFSNLDQRLNSFNKTIHYDEDKASLVCRNDVAMSFTESGELDPDTRLKMVVNANSIEAKWTQHFKHQAKRLKISTQIRASAQELLKAIKQKNADCTLMNRLDAQFHLRAFTNLKILKDISPLQSFFFLVSHERPELQSQFHKWLTKNSQHFLVAQTKARVRGKISELTIHDQRRFANDREQILPKYFSIIRKHAAEFGLPWQLMAAIAYQESRWNPDAESFTGVKGFMQLTSETAEHLGVEDREDAAQSIWGGVKYIKMLINRQPKGLLFRDRLALALATYNVGPAHMMDAQKLALKLGKNPYSWKDLQTVLPLLAEADYLPELKYGPARGTEPVIYVKRVFSYLELMSVQI
jgi:membrane-bound lytic murein transglycosylase F